MINVKDKWYTREKPDFLTFGDLKVGDEFIINKTYNGDKQSFEKIAPYKDEHGYWVNAKLVKTKPGFFYFNMKEIIVLDQQEVERVEKKLTIYDLKPGDRFMFMSGHEVHTKVSDHFQPSDQCSYMDKTFVINTTKRDAIVKMEPKESDPEDGDKKHLTLGDLKKRDKFQFVRNKENDELLCIYAASDINVDEIFTVSCDANKNSLFAKDERGYDRAFNGYRKVILVKKTESPEFKD